MCKRVTPVQFSSKVKSYRSPIFLDAELKNIRQAYWNRLYKKKLDADLISIEGKTRSLDPLIDTGLLNESTTLKQIGKVGGYGRKTARRDNVIAILVDDARDWAILKRLQSFYGDRVFDMADYEHELIEDLIQVKINQFFYK